MVEISIVVVDHTYDTAIDGEQPPVRELSTVRQAPAAIHVASLRIYLSGTRKPRIGESQESGGNL